MMSTTEKIKIVLVMKKLTQRDLAEKLNCTPANLSKKMIKDNWKESDLQEVAKVLGVEVEINFKIGDKII